MTGHSRPLRRSGPWRTHEDNVHAHTDERGICAASVYAMNSLIRVDLRARPAG
jgi:hypothetical protein|eukprot:COSAG01_NODE_3668_length_5811_cov_52.307598_3_plen_53_part_00